MAHRRLAWLLVLFAAAIFAAAPHAQTPSANTVTGKASGGDFEMVQKLNSLRKDYQKSLEQLRVFYHQVQDKERERWATEELIAFHRIPKNAFILDLDLPPPNLPGDLNVPEANKIFTWAMKFKDHSYGTEYIDNQRRAEVLFQAILDKYPRSNKISAVAYNLGDVYESKAYRQFSRAVEYYHRCYQYNPKTTLDARIRAARLYDSKLNNRTKAIEVYREVTTHETDPQHIQEAQKRIAELSGSR